MKIVYSKELMHTRYHTHDGLILPGIIGTRTPTNPLQSQKINVTNHFAQVRQKANIQTNQAKFVGGYVQHSLVVGLHLFVDVEPIVSEGDIMSMIQSLGNRQLTI